MIDNACVLGGEESGGYAFAGHVPERDGPLSALFFLESMAISGKSPTELLAEIHQITGPHTFRRIDIEFTPDQRQRITTAVNGKAPTTLGGIEVVSEDRRDGVRLDLNDGSWAVIRMSGTEPLLRIYAEASSEQATRRNPQRFSDAFGSIAPFAKRKGREQAQRCERGMPAPSCHGRGRSVILPLGGPPLRKAQLSLPLPGGEYKGRQRGMPGTSLTASFRRGKGGTAPSGTNTPSAKPSLLRRLDRRVSQLRN